MASLASLIYELANWGQSKVAKDKSPGAMTGAFVFSVPKGIWFL